MAVWVTAVPGAGTVPKSIGDVSTKVAVGNCAVFMMRPWNCASRRDWSLWTDVRSAVKLAASTEVPVIVRVPDADEVRP